MGKRLNLERKAINSLSPILLEAAILFLILAVALLLEFSSRGLLLEKGVFNKELVELILIRSAAIAIAFSLAYRLAKSGVFVFIGLFSSFVSSDEVKKRTLLEYLIDIFITLVFILTTIPIRPILQKVYLEGGLQDFSQALVRFDALPSMLILSVVGVPIIIMSFYKYKGKTRWIYSVGVIVAIIVVGLINSKPNYPARVYESRADWIERDWEKQGIDAQKALEDAQTDSEKAVAYYWLGVSANRQDQYHKALEYNLKAVELDPNYGAPHSSLSASYRMLGDLEKARFHAERCVELSPHYAWCYYSLAAYYEFAGDRETAFKYLEKAYNLDPDAVDIKKTYEIMKNYQ